MFHTGRDGSCQRVDRGLYIHAFEMVYLWVRVCRHAYHLPHGRSHQKQAAMKLTFTAAAAKVMYTKAVLLKEGLVKGDQALVEWFRQVKTTDTDNDGGKAEDKKEAAEARRFSLFVSAHSKY